MADQKCCICLGDFCNRTKIDCCNHQFCYECIQCWTKQQESGENIAPICPMCRRPYCSYNTEEQKELEYFTFSSRYQPASVTDVLYQAVCAALLPNNTILQKYVTTNFHRKLAAHLNQSQLGSEQEEDCITLFRCAEISKVVAEHIKSKLRNYEKYIAKAQERKRFYSLALDHRPNSLDSLGVQTILKHGLDSFFCSVSYWKLYYTTSPQLTQQSLESHSVHVTFTDFLDIELFALSSNQTNSTRLLSLLLEKLPSVVQDCETNATTQHKDKSQKSVCRGLFTLTVNKLINLLVEAYKDFEILPQYIHFLCYRIIFIITGSFTKQLERKRRNENQSQNQNESSALIAG